MMLSLLSVLLFTVAVLACIGRTSVPARERLPVTSWGVKDLWRNVLRGIDVCAAHTPLQRVLDQPTDKTTPNGQ